MLMIFKVTVTNKKGRRSQRLKEYDYSQPGYYYVTLCTHNREHLFGEVSNGTMHLNDYGEIVKDELLKSEQIRREIKIVDYVIMPNHVHVIIVIENQEICNIQNVGANGRSPLRMRSKSISSFISGYKSVCTKRINIIRHYPGISIWQRKYYELIIRNERELYELRRYIVINPMKWELYEYYEILETVSDHSRGLS